MSQSIYLKRAYTAGFLLGGRKFISQLIITSSNLVLARILFPSDFGIYALVLYAMTFFMVFSDIGLGPALIQKHIDITPKDISSALIVQYLLSIIIIGVIFLGSTAFAALMGMGIVGISLIRLQSLTFLLLPFKTIGVAILERSLQYKQLTFIETLEQLVSVGTTIVLALRGIGVISFAYGAIAGLMIAVVLYYFYSRWQITMPSMENLKKLLHFGVPVQTTVVLGLFYGPLIYLYMGKIVSQMDVGYFQLASGFAAFPLAFSEILSRILFPLVSRTVKDVRTVAKLYIGTFVLTALVTIPVVLILFIFADTFVLFVYGARWLPIVTAVRILLLNTLILAFTTISTQVLLALNEARWVRKMNLVWILLTWTIAPILIRSFNFVGMCLAMLIVSASGLLLILKTRKLLQVSFVPRSPFSFILNYFYQFLNP